MSYITAENMCCTVQQAKELMNKGIMPFSLHAWILTTHFTELPPKYAIGLLVDSDPLFRVPAYTVAELGAMLLKEARDCHYHQPSGMWSHSNTMWNKENAQDLFSTQAECYGDRLLYLMHQYPIKYPAEFVNARLKKFYELKRETV